MTTDFPTTQNSLLRQVQDSGNHAAWQQFASIYRPVIYRFARARGLQAADADDLAQVVLAAVADRIPEWEPDKSRARFRTWLIRIAMNQTITMLRRRKADQARGGTTGVAVLHGQFDEVAPDDRSGLELSYRREAFRHVAHQVRREFEETTWQAFWMTAVEGSSIADVAALLGRSVGSIYTARSRVIRRLQERARRQDDEWPFPPQPTEVPDD